jgi:hypothetical protein
LSFPTLEIGARNKPPKNRKYLDYHKILLRMVDVRPWNRVIPPPVQLYL